MDYRCQSRSRVSQHLQCRCDAIVLDKQLHTARSPLHPGADTDDDGGYAGSIQRDPRQIRFNPR